MERKREGRCIVNLNWANDVITWQCLDGKPVSVREYEKHAVKTLPKNAFTYYASGARDVFTLRENITAYNRWVQRCRVHGISNGDDRWFKFFLSHQLFVTNWTCKNSSFLSHTISCALDSLRLRIRPRVLRDVSNSRYGTPKLLVQEEVDWICAVRSVEWLTYKQTINYSNLARA